MLKNIITLQVENELRICPGCGYERGFHVSFVNRGVGNEKKAGTTREIYRVILICPECDARYDIGWEVSLSGFGELPVQPPVCVPHGNPADCVQQRKNHDKNLP